MSLMQWAKRSLASLLGKHKDSIKKLPIIKQLNQKANKELDEGRQALLRANFDRILEIVYDQDHLNFDLWLDFGSLLGYYREGGRIEHDIDMDFALKVSDLEAFDVYEGHLLANGFRKRKDFTYEGKVVERAYDFNGLNIDFIFYKVTETQFSSVTIDFKINAIGQPTRLMAYRYQLPLMEIDWAKMEEHKVMVPQECHRYLSLLYGADFMEPNTHYHWQANPIYQQVSSEPAQVKLLP